MSETRKRKQSTQSHFSQKAGTASWCVDRIPFLDWLCWNACMRLLLPVFFLIILLVPLSEYLSGGGPALEALLTGRFFPTVLGLFVLSVIAAALFLILQGPDVLDCSADSSGIHVACYLPRPTVVKLLARFRSPDLEAGDDGMVLISRRDLPWSSVRRVQLWPGRTTVLLHERGAFASLAVPCTPFSYESLLGMIRSRLGKNQAVRMPLTLRPESFREKLVKARQKLLAVRTAKHTKPKKKKPPKQAAKHSGRKGTGTAGTRSGGSAKPVRKPAPTISIDEIRRMNAEDEAEALRRDAKQKGR